MTRIAGHRGAGHAPEPPRSLADSSARRLRPKPGVRQRWELCQVSVLLHYGVFPFNKDAAISCCARGDILFNDAALYSSSAISMNASLSASNSAYPPLSHSPLSMQRSGVRHSASFQVPQIPHLD